MLAAGGQSSSTGPLMLEMMQEVAETVSELRVPGAGHWIAEENPERLLEALIGFSQHEAHAAKAAPSWGALAAPGLGLDDAVQSWVDCVRDAARGRTLQ